MCAGSNQIWLTCLDPQMLVDKYVEYAHGNRLGDRRIVLDSTLLPDILAAGNMRVVPPSLLLERSLATIRSECRIAKDLTSRFLFSSLVTEMNIRVELVLVGRKRVMHHVSLSHP